MAYQLEGSMLEVCTCNVLCPCWVGEDPDSGTCDSAMAYHFDNGNINGVDVSGLTLGFVIHIPGNILKGNWRTAVYVDEKATEDQEEALLNVFTGKLGGPVADLAQLVGEVVSVERAPITHGVEGVKGTLKIGQVAEAEMEPYKGPTGEVTTLNESIFTSIPGAPAYVGKASSFRSSNQALGHNLNIKNHNAIQGAFRFEG
jgi:hypothetical protein